MYTLSLNIGTGGTAVYISNAAGSPQQTLFGIPILYVEQCSQSGQLNDAWLVDMQAYAIAEKGGIQSASTIALKFSTDETSIRWVLRSSGNPLFSSATTSFKGSVSESPYIRLQARS